MLLPDELGIEVDVEGGDDLQAGAARGGLGGTSGWAVRAASGSVTLTASPSVRARTTPLPPLTSRAHAAVVTTHRET